VLAVADAGADHEGVESMEIQLSGIRDRSDRDLVTLLFDDLLQPIADLDGVAVVVE